MTATTSTSTPRFRHGRVIVSPGVIERALQERIDVLSYFERHLHGDWGNVRLAYGLMNEAALQSGRRLLSVFEIGPDLTLWVVTQLDRSVTILLLPDEHDAFQADLST